MKITFFGSSLLSSYWNGAATYYRGIIKYLNQRGHSVTFYEPDILERQRHRDYSALPYAQSIVYPANNEGQVLEALSTVGHTDVLVTCGGIGAYDDLIAESLLLLANQEIQTVFWDVDAPATLKMLESGQRPLLRQLLRGYDWIFTYGGGQSVVDRYCALGAKACVPIYNALDPEDHFQVASDPRFQGQLGLLANRLPDREARLEEFFFKPAATSTAHKFLLGGSGWEDKVGHYSSISYLGHVTTREHNAFNSSADFILNVSRDSMAEVGFSPATRVFEAAGAEACLITDSWKGIEQFLKPEEECLVAHNGEDVSSLLTQVEPKEAKQIGARARQRLLSEHTYLHRALVVEATLNLTSRGRGGVLSRTRLRAVRTPTSKMNLVFIGLTLSSSWGNGHATTYRSLLKALSARGHSVTFLEYDAPWYRNHRDLTDPSFCNLHFYSSLDELTLKYTEMVQNADVTVVGSFVQQGTEVGLWATQCARKGVTAFYDIDTPRTVALLEEGTCEYLSPEVAPSYDLYMSFAGGELLQRLRKDYLVQRPVPLYCSVDPSLYYPDKQDTIYDLGYLGTYSIDRQEGLEELLLKTARHLPESRFVVAGAQYPQDIRWPENTTYYEHCPPHDHRAFFSQQRYTLNLTRQDMRAAGYSPSVRLFEAAACRVPLISDRWEGIEEIFIPDEEILLASSREEVVEILAHLPEKKRISIAEQAQKRVLAHHTAEHRAQEFENYIASL